MYLKQSLAQDMECWQAFLSSVAQRGDLYPQPQLGLSVQPEHL